MIHFAYNPTSWDDVAGGPVPGGMADALVCPITEHLPDGTYSIGPTPMEGAVNVYYTHRQTYPGTSALAERGRAGVFASHGIADKGWRNATRMSGHFSHAITSGPAWSERLLAGGVTGVTVIEAGYPKLDPIFAGTVPSAWPDRDGRVRVLWAPTHGGGGERSAVAGGGDSVSTWWRRDQVLDLLPPSEFDVMEAPHPRHRPDRRSTLGEYVGADVVIADGGSTMYEAWALGLPVVFPAWLTGARNIARSHQHGSTFEGDIYRRRVGRHAVAAGQIARLCAEAAERGITEAEVDFIEPILPERYRGHSGRLHAEALLDIVDRRPPRHQPSVASLRFRHVGGREVTLAAWTPKAKRYARSEQWEVVDA